MWSQWNAYELLSLEIQTSLYFLLDIAKPSNPTGDQTFRSLLEWGGEGRMNLLTEKMHYPCATLLTRGRPRCELWIKMKGVFRPSHCRLERRLDFFPVQFLQGEEQITINNNLYTFSTCRQAPPLCLGCLLSALSHPCRTNKKGRCIRSSGSCLTGRLKTCALDGPRTF